MIGAGFNGPAIPGAGTTSASLIGTTLGPFFVTSAVSSAGDDTIKTGLYGDVAPVDDLSEHRFFLTAIDRHDGKVETLAAMGLRIGETVGLRWTDLDLESGEIMFQRARFRGEEISTKGRRYRNPSPPTWPTG